MEDVAISLPKEKLIEGLSNLSFAEIKEIMDSLMRRKLFQPPTAKSLYDKASKITKTKKLSPDAAVEAVNWTRSRRS